MIRFIKTSLKRMYVDSLQTLLGMPFFYEPPMHTFKTKIANSLLGSNLGANVVVLDGVKILNWSNLSISDYSYISNNVTIRAQGKIQIGRGVIVGPEAFISNGDHSLADLTPSSAPIIIGDGVYIGARAMILGGVTIGDHAVIGAGAIVTKDIPACAVCVGIPAKVVKYREKPELTWTILGYKNI